MVASPVIINNYHKNMHIHKVYITIQDFNYLNNVVALEFYYTQYDHIKNYHQVAWVVAM